MHARRLRNFKGSDTYQFRMKFWLVLVEGLGAGSNNLERMQVIGEELEVRNLERRLGGFREKEENLRFSES